MKKLTITIPCNILPDVPNLVSKEENIVTHETTGELKCHVDGGGGKEFEALCKKHGIDAIELLYTGLA